MLACVFAYQGWRLSEEGAERWRVYGSYALTVVLGSLGLAGMRERHRH